MNRAMAFLAVILVGTIFIVIFGTAVGREIETVRVLSHDVEAADESVVIIGNFNSVKRMGERTTAVTTDQTIQVDGRYPAWHLFVIWIFVCLLFLVVILRGMVKL